MKIGYHTIRWGYGKVFHSFQQILSEISSAQFEGFGTHIVDIMPFFDHENRFLEILGKTKMQLVSIYTTMHEKKLLSRLLPQSVRNRRYIKLARFADSVGCRRLILAAPVVKKKNTCQRDYVNLARELNKIGEICSQSNVELSFHSHLGTMVEDSLQLARLFELLDSDFVHLTLDTGHLVAAGVDPASMIKAYRERINHVELKDYKEEKWTEFGEGAIDFSTILKTLDSVGYNDWLVIEDEVNCSVPMQGSTNRTPYQSAERSRKKLDQLSEEIRNT